MDNDLAHVRRSILYDHIYKRMILELTSVTLQIGTESNNVTVHEINAE